MRPAGRWSVPLAAVLLIAVGTVLLLQNIGLLPWSLWLSLLRFWPVLLIAIGVRIILGRGLLSSLVVAALLLLALGGAALLALGQAPRLGPGELRETFREERSSAERLEATFRFGAGELKVAALPEGSGDLVAGQLVGARASLRRQGSTAELRVSSGPRWWPFGGEMAGGSWRIELSREVPIEMEVDAGAADLQLDLTALRVTRLDLDAGASNVVVLLPARVAEGSVEVDAGAANVTLTVPPEVAARIVVKGPLTSLNVDRSRFQPAGGAYVSEGFERAERRLTIGIDAAASSVTVR